MRALAFYKGKGNWIDWCIRFATRSEYSHVELVITHEFKEKDRHFCVSSSARDGGVRHKAIKMKPDHWDIIELHWEPKNKGITPIDERGKKYDYRGILLSQFFNLGRHSEERWFCSEFCAAYLGLPDPQTYSPGSLFKTIDLMNVAFWNGQRAGKPEPSIWNPKKPKG